MIVFAIVLPSAQAEPLQTPVAVESIEWARPFRLVKPVVYRHTREWRPVQEGWLLELRVDAKFQIPHPIHTPVLWVDDTVAVRTNWRSSCAVVWVPGAHNLKTALLYYGSTELPERLGQTEGTAWLERAQLAGLRPPPFRGVTDRPLLLQDFTELMGIAAGRVERCSTDGPTKR